MISKAPASQFTDLASTDIENVEAATREFISFTVGERAYCVEITSVREIRTWTSTTRLPNCADHVLGVINLRGVIVPVIDLRKRFAQGETFPTSSNVIVVVAINNQLNGLLVDGVSDILTVGEDDIAAVPEDDDQGKNPFLDGVIAVDKGNVGLIDLERIADRSLAFEPCLAASNTADEKKSASAKKPAAAKKRAAGTKKPAAAKKRAGAKKAPAAKKAAGVKKRAAAKKTAGVKNPKVLKKPAAAKRAASAKKTTVAKRTPRKSNKRK